MLDAASRVSYVYWIVGNLNGSVLLKVCFQGWRDWDALTLSGRGCNLAQIWEGSLYLLAFTNTCHTSSLPGPFGKAAPLLLYPLPHLLPTTSISHPEYCLCMIRLGLQSQTSNRKRSQRSLSARFSRSYIAPDLWCLFAFLEGTHSLISSVVNKAVWRVKFVSHCLHLPPTHVSYTR